MKQRIIILTVLAAALSGTGALQAQGPDEAWFTLHKIAPNVWAAVDNPKSKQRSYELFDYLVPRNIAEAEAEQNGTKRVPQP